MGAVVCHRLKPKKIDKASGVKNIGQIYSTFSLLKVALIFLFPSHFFSPSLLLVLKRLPPAEETASLKVII
jgi:hypothetical protein